MTFADPSPCLLDSRNMDLTPAQAAFLSEPHICVMATADSEGQPHAVPVWFQHESDAICVMIEKGSKKHRNLLQNPKVSLAFDRRSPPYYAFMISGPVELDEEASYDDLLHIAAKYLGEERGKEYTDSMTPSDLVIVRLRSGQLVEHMPE